MKRVWFLFSILMCLLVFQDVQASGSSPPGLKLEVNLSNYSPVFAVVDAPQTLLVAELVPTLYMSNIYQGTVCQGQGIMNQHLIYVISKLNTGIITGTDETTQLKRY